MEKLANEPEQSVAQLLSAEKLIQQDINIVNLLKGISFDKDDILAESRQIKGFF